jgi:hypothetical protein
MNKPLMWIFAATAWVALPQTALAQSTVQTRQYSGANRISRGVVDLGIDSLWIVGHTAEGDASSTRLTLISGLTARYFVRDNLGVGLSASGFYKTLGAEDSDTGVIVNVIANYYLRLGDGMFLAPGIGAGGLIGSRTTPIANDMTLQSDLVGATIVATLPLTLFAWERFNVRGGLSVLASFGSASREGATDSETFVDVDGGFSVGAGYYF